MSIVMRRVLKTYDAFEAFCHEHGGFRYSLSGLYDRNVYPDILLDDDEWLFSDDLIALTKELLQWDQRGVYVVWEEPSEDDYAIGGPDITGSWGAENFPEDAEEFGCYVMGQLFKEGRIAPSSSPDEVAQIFLRACAADLDNFDGVLFLDFEDKHTLQYLDDWRKEDNAGNS
jgi:hypothetical protein